MVHNAGRTQVAAAWLAHLAAGRVTVRQGGSAPAEAVNPGVVAAMAELGIDVGRRMPRAWTDDPRREPQNERLGRLVPIQLA